MNSFMNDLTNKIKQDAIFTMILGVGTAWGSTIYLIRWITTVLSASYETNNIINYAKNFGKFGLTAVAILFLGSILKSICKGMKPFETVSDVCSRWCGFGNHCRFYRSYFFRKHFYL